MSLHNLLKDAQRNADKSKAPAYKRFFKDAYTRSSDRFIGLPLPEQRKIIKRNNTLNFKEIKKLLDSDIHEYRMLGALSILERFKNEQFNRELIFNFYIKNIKAFDNWDLIDITAPKILGASLLLGHAKEKILYDFLKSPNMWIRRIAIVSTLELIRSKKFVLPLDILKKSLQDKEDLIHKPVGWMLREIGKRDKEKLIEFLKKNYKKIHRTTLRYSIERLPEEQRLNIMRGDFS